LPQISFGDAPADWAATTPCPAIVRHQLACTFTHPLQHRQNQLKFGYEYRRTTVKQFYDLAIGGLSSPPSRFSGGTMTNGAACFSGDSQRTTTRTTTALFQDNFRRRAS